MNLSETIFSETERLYPGVVTRKQVDKYVRVMLSLISASIINRQKNEFDERTEEFAFSQNRAVRECGRYGPAGKQAYVYRLLRENSTTSLVIEKFKGNVGRNSRVELNPLYKEKIVEELLNLRIEDNQYLLEEMGKNSNVEVPVDVESLRMYASKTDMTIASRRADGKASSDFDTYYDALTQNLLVTKQLLMMINPADESHDRTYLKEYWIEKDSGRRYGIGYSLQRMKKEIRHAALGVCHKYDFKACSFALMASLAMSIDQTLEVPNLVDYIKNRARIRSRIATQINVSEDLIKTIFTSMGFGAELDNNPYSSIRKSLSRYAASVMEKSDERLEKEAWKKLGEEEFQRLINNETFQQVYSELHQVNTTILQYLDDDMELFGRKYDPIDRIDYQKKMEKFKGDESKFKPKRKTDKQKLAWIYQVLESNAVKRMVDLVREFDGMEPLLEVHDCVYYPQMIRSNTVVDVTIELNDQFPLLRFEHEKVFPIRSDEDFQSYFNERDSLNKEHEQRMRQEEERARTYVPRSVTQVKLVCDNTSASSIIDSLKDQPDYEYELPDYR